MEGLKLSRTRPKVSWFPAAIQNPPPDGRRLALASNQAARGIYPGIYLARSNLSHSERWT